MLELLLSIKREGRDSLLELVCLYIFTFILYYLVFHLNSFHLTSALISILKLTPPQGPFTTQDLLDAIHCQPVPDTEFSDVPKGTPGAGQTAIYPVFMNTKKAKEVLGLQFTGLEKTARDTARSLLPRGW
jgi:hypothetical protein